MEQLETELTASETAKQQKQYRQENIEHEVKTLQRRIGNLQDQNCDLKHTGCALKEEKSRMDSKRKTIRDKAIAHVAKMNAC